MTPEQIERDRVRKRIANMNPDEVERKYARQRARAHQLISEGKCHKCTKPKLTEWRCWDCLNKTEGARWRVLTITPDEMPSMQLARLSA